MKKKLILWGGWHDKERPLFLSNIDSHASVSAYFLTKYLSAYYDVVNINNFNAAKEILNHKDAVAVFSTFQSGFTRMNEKGKRSEFELIRKEFGGKLCSIVDDIYRLKYKEDILFTVKPPKPKMPLFIKGLANKGIIIERCGWPADPEICFPEYVPEDEINIFVDHGWYGGILDCSRVYFNAFKKIVRDYPEVNFNIYRQNNDGVVNWNLSGKFKESKYIRNRKTPYLDILKIYRRSHIFCVTHPESAGLAAIEAAMCGAKLFVPSFFGRSFISKDLLRDGVEYVGVKMIERNIINSLRNNIEKGFDRERTRAKILRNNTWERAAGRIHSVLSKKA